MDIGTCLELGKCPESELFQGYISLVDELVYCSRYHWPGNSLRGGRRTRWKIGRAESARLSSPVTALEEVICHNSKRHSYQYITASKPDTVECSSRLTHEGAGEESVKPVKRKGKIASLVEEIQDIQPRKIPPKTAPNLPSIFLKNSYQYQLSVPTFQIPHSCRHLSPWPSS